MQKLTYETRENHLEKHPEQQKNRKKITKKIGKEIFEVLSAKDYKTSFETRKTDDYYKSPYRFYHDYSFKQALKTIKSLLGIWWSLRYQTIDKLISFTQEIQSLSSAIDTISIQSNPNTLLEKENNSDLYYRDENGVWYFNFFPEEKQKTEVELAKTEQKNRDTEMKNPEATPKEDEGRDENDYSDRLRQH